MEQDARVPVEDIIRRYKSACLRQGLEGHCGVRTVSPPAQRLPKVTEMAATSRTTADVALVRRKKRIPIVMTMTTAVNTSQTH